MTLEEYKTQYAALEEEYKTKCNELAKAYAFANNPYKIGDILQDHYQILRVEKIKWEYYNYFNKPECVYYGTQLTKKLEPKKKQDAQPGMYQSNVKRKLN